MTGRLSIVTVVTLLGAVLRTTASPDMFTAKIDVQRALDDEQSAVGLIRHYVRQERDRLDVLERLAEGWEQHSSDGLNNIDRYLFHPVNYFLMAKHFAIDWQMAIDKYVRTSTTQDFLAALESSTINYPDMDNFLMSASALLRLQDTYELPTTDLSSGRVGSNSSPAMTADDCFQLGKSAYEVEDFYHSVLWFSEALRIGDEEHNKTTTKTIVLDYLSFSVFKQGNLHHAYNLAIQWLELEPNHARAQSNLQHYQQLIREEEQKHRRERLVVARDTKLRNERILDPHRSTPEFAAYEKLCRGEIPDQKIDTETRSQLVCRYRRHVPITYIRPLKEEVLYVSPKIVFYHDVVTDSEIAKIKELAIPKLHRSGVFALKDSSQPYRAGHTSYRTSKSAWLLDCDDRLIARVSRKASALSNLTLESAEDLQVLNYGIGGHYEPHYDFVRKDEQSQFNDWQGNRVATVICYLNDIISGGLTVFNLLGVGHEAEKGSCMLWYNLLTSGEGDYRTKHAGCPVLVGTKWVANKWLHTGGQEFSRPCSLREDE